MTLNSKRPATLAGANGPRNSISGKSGCFENTETLTLVQAKWIARRAGIAPDLARLVASLAFDGGRHG